MADDQQLWGYPEVAAHLGISVRAARSRKSRAVCRSPTTPACRTGRAGGPPPSRAGSRSAEGSAATCTALASFTSSDSTCSTLSCAIDLERRWSPTR